MEQRRDRWGYQQFRRLFFGMLFTYSFNIRFGLFLFGSTGTSRWLLVGLSDPFVAHDRKHVRRTLDGLAETKSGTATGSSGFSITVETVWIEQIKKSIAARTIWSYDGFFLEYHWFFLVLSVPALSRETEQLDISAYNQ